MVTKRRYRAISLPRVSEASGLKPCAPCLSPGGYAPAWDVDVCRVNSLRPVKPPTALTALTHRGTPATHFYHLERPSKLPVCDFVVCCLLTARLCMFPVVLLNLDVSIFRPLPLLLLDVMS